LTRANTEKDLGGILRTRSRALTEEEVAAVNAASPKTRMVPEWGGEGECQAAVEGWLWPLQLCCAVALSTSNQAPR
jgi:hypothetical protein